VQRAYHIKISQIVFQYISILNCSANSPPRRLRNEPHEDQHQHTRQPLHRQRDPPHKLLSPRHEIQPILQPRAHNRAEKETCLKPTRQLAPVFRISHFNYITRPSCLHHHSTHAEDEAARLQGTEVLGRGLQDRAHDTNEAADRHPDAAAVAVGAGAGKEGARDVADDVEGGDEALVVRVDAKERDKGGNGGEAPCPQISQWPVPNE
jgi:hypothetical protein